MSLTVEQAYTQLKTLENTGQLKLPQPKEIVNVGSIDISTGVFTWKVPTFVKTLVIPPHPPVKTNTIINTTVGLVATKAVDLVLRFEVKGVQPANTALAAGPIQHVGSTVFDVPSGIKIIGFPTIVDTSREIEV